MMLRATLAVLLCAVCARSQRQYLNEWAVEVPGGLHAARTIADELGYELVRQVGGWETTYVLRYSIFSHIHPSLVNACGFAWCMHGFLFGLCMGFCWVYAWVFVLIRGLFVFLFVFLEALWKTCISSKS